MSGIDLLLAVVVAWSFTALVVIGLKRSARRESVRKQQPAGSVRLIW